MRPPARVQLPFQSARGLDHRLLTLDDRADPGQREIQQLIEFLAVESAVFARPLDLDETSRPGRDNVHIDLSTDVFLVGKIQHRQPPDDADRGRNGWRSGLEMLGEMATLNERLRKEAEEEGRKHIPLKVGLGLNSGLAVVGNMGSDQRFDYSVLGDIVNLAARLEGQSKSYGVDIVLGRDTWIQVPEMATIELDLIQVKGKTVGVNIFVLLGGEEMEQNPDFRNLRKIHEQMITAYRAQQWDSTKAKIKECRILCEPYGLDFLYDLYETRIADFEADPPAPDWDGGFIATTK